MEKMSLHMNKKKIGGEGKLGIKGRNYAVLEKNH